MTNAYIVTGTLTDGTTLKLDEEIPLSVGKVRVTVEAVPADTKPAFRLALERIWAEQIASGHVPPTPEEVAARIREVRAGWDE